MKKNSLVREKNIKVCYSNIEPKDTNIWKILYSSDSLYIYTIVTKENQTFRKIRKQYMDIYKKVLKVRKRMYQITSKGKIRELYSEYKEEIKLEKELQSILKCIKNISIDMELLNKSILSRHECNFTKNDLRFIQLLLLNDGNNIKIPGLEEKERTLIIKKDNRYTI